ncbi:unnamed protein product [Lathyrus sativus]|nr:unnamed protein product [Lathyrus sativus]
MEHHQSSDEKFEKFIWKVENFSHLIIDHIYSEPFVLGGYPWRIILYPSGICYCNYLSIHLEAMQTANMSEGWSRDVKFCILCSDHPSLIESHLNNDFAFAALGRVLYFLKTRKVKDMNEQACKDLQVLWEELEKYGFNLSWLEPHVQSALAMKNYVRNVLLMKKVKEDMVILELETERLNAKLAALELNLDVERDLRKEKGLEERDLDFELGYGS